MVLTADLPTLLGVITGIAVLTGLICFVLKLFSSNRYPHPRHYANANLAPPLLFSSDNQWINGMNTKSLPMFISPTPLFTKPSSFKFSSSLYLSLTGIPLTVHGRPSSRSSSQRSTTNLAHYSRSKGVLVPASRAGAARAAAILLIPCHLQASRTSEPDVINNSNNDDTDVQENDLEQSSHPGNIQQGSIILLVVCSRCPLILLPNFFWFSLCLMSDVFSVSVLNISLVSR